MPLPFQGWGACALAQEHERTEAGLCFKVRAKTPIPFLFSVADRAFIIELAYHDRQE